MIKGIIENLLNATVIYPFLSGIFKINFIMDWKLTEYEVVESFKIGVLEILYLIVILLTALSNKGCDKKEKIIYFFKQWAGLFIFSLVFSFIYYPINKGPSNIDQVKSIAQTVAVTVLGLFALKNFCLFNNKQKKV